MVTPESSHDQFCSEESPKKVLSTITIPESGKVHPKAYDPADPDPDRHINSTLGQDGVKFLSGDDWAPASDVSGQIVESRNSMAEQLKRSTATETNGAATEQPLRICSQKCLASMFELSVHPFGTILNSNALTFQSASI